MDKGTRWSSQLAFYILAIGSAFGLGNLWRFPFVVGSNGGGAFILLYLFLLFVIGLPLIIAELMMGKAERGSVIHVTRRLSRQAGPWVRWVGWGAFALSVVVFGYYSIISGWVLFYISQFLRQIVEPSGILEPAALFENVWLQISLVSVHLLFLGFVVSKGIKEGIEKLAVFVMPVFILMLGMILYRTLSLPSVSGALRFLFYPDFRELGWTSLAHAIGHVFFTLGVGFGVLVTFSSYLREEEYVPGLGLRVAVMDAVASLSAVLIIFPVVFLAADTSISHPALMFEVLPRFILGLPYGNYWGFVFFVCLYLSAFNASLGLFEAIVSGGMSILSERASRTVTTAVLGGVVFLLSLLPFISAVVSPFGISGLPAAIEVMDRILVNWFLPLLGALLGLALFRGTDEETRSSLFLRKDNRESFALYPYWRALVGLVIPFLVVFALVFEVIGLVVT